MSSAEASKKMIVLKSSEGDTFEVEELVAMESQTIKHMIEDDCAGTVIPLPNVTSKILVKVIEYCRRHVEAASKPDANGVVTPEYKLPDKELNMFDSDFVNVDQGTLFNLVLAANYLNIKSLLDRTCQAVADTIKDKTPQEIRTLFNITNDYSGEEEDEVRRQYAWAFE